MVILRWSFQSVQYLLGNRPGRNKSFNWKLGFYILSQEFKSSVWFSCAVSKTRPCHRSKTARQINICCYHTLDSQSVKHLRHNLSNVIQSFIPVEGMDHDKKLLKCQTIKQNYPRFKQLSMFWFNSIPFSWDWSIISLRQMEGFYNMYFNR